MKKLIFVFSLFCCSGLYAQTDTLLIEQYCEVVATQRFLSNKVTIDVDYGDPRGLFQTNRVKDESGNLKKFNTIIDALNYLGKNGWRLVNAFPITYATNNSVDNTTYHYVFKRYYPKSVADQP